MKPIEPAYRTKKIKYAIRDIVVLADQLKREGKKILSLNIGDPCPFGFAPPESLIEAVTEAMNQNKNGYAPAMGVPEAVEALKNEALGKGIRDLQSVFVTTGASEAIELCLTALLDPGDNVLLPAPGYPLYSAIMAKLDTPTNFYYLDEENQWLPDLDDIASRINSRTRGIVLINPNNPTGAVYDRETLLGIVNIAKEHNLVIFADEIYDKLVFDGNTHISIASLTDEVPIITFGGLSKNYVTPGWRIGWGIISGPHTVISEYEEGIKKMLRARLCANHPEQFAIPVALEECRDHLPEMIKELDKRRHLTVSRLNEMDKVTCVNPGGAFYVFPRLHIEKADEDFCRAMLKETGVMTVFGSGFGQKPDTKHLRIVYLPAESILADALDRMEEFLKKYS